MSMWIHHKNTVMIIHPLSYAARRGDEREAKFRNYLFSYSTDKHPEIWFIHESLLFNITIYHTIIQIIHKTALPLKYNIYL